MYTSVGITMTFLWGIIERIFHRYLTIFIVVEWIHDSLLSWKEQCRPISLRWGSFLLFFQNIGFTLVSVPLITLAPNHCRRLDSVPCFKPRRLDCRQLAHRFWLGVSPASMADVKGKLTWWLNRRSTASYQNPHQSTPSLLREGKRNQNLLL